MNIGDKESDGEYKRQIKDTDGKDDKDIDNE